MSVKVQVTNNDTYDDSMIAVSVFTRTKGSTDLVSRKVLKRGESTNVGVYQNPSSSFPDTVIHVQQVYTEDGK